MKKHIVGVFGFALLLAAASAHAQITQTTRVQVPFPFVAAGQNMPAADYSVTIDLNVYQWTLNFHPSAGNKALT